MTLLLGTLNAPGLFATCTATITMQETSPGTVAVTLTGKGSCTANGANGGPVTLYERAPGGTWISEKNCADGECVFSYSYGASCGNTQSRELSVTCSRNNSSGTGCESDPDGGYATQSITLSHEGTISLSENYDYKTVAGTTAVSGKVHVHAPDAWGYRGIQKTWQHADGTTQDAGYIAIGADSLIDQDVPFSADGGLTGSTLTLTLISCGDPQNSVAIDVEGSYSCGTGPGPLPMSVAASAITTGAASSSCSRCVGTPVRLSDGDMQMTDVDALPAAPLARTFNTLGPSETWFGTGWSSMFDRALRSFPTAPGGPWAHIWINGTKRYVFRRQGTTWVQTWPQGSTRAVLLTDVGGNYVLREPGKDAELVIEPQNGLPIMYRSRATGRALTISYAGTTPQSVADSWGTFSWTITATNHRIDSIAIDGTSLVWQYIYTGALLTSVNGPGGATWRFYTYSGNNLTEARDAAGRTIESHAYDGSGRATTSVQTQDDIQSINYNAGTRNNSNERAIQVQYASGAITTYWVAYVAGDIRTVEIDGNCTSCGVNNAVYAYKLGDFTDQGGELLRSQDARGYITTYTYDTNKRLTSVTMGYRPSACDPEADAARCKQTPTALLTIPLTATPATETTTYSYDDPAWPDRPTSTTRASVVGSGQTTTRTVTYAAASGVVLTEAVTGSNGTSSETHLSATLLYDGTEGAAFNPGGAFSASWLTLPQPAGMTKAVDGPRTDVTDATTWVYYPVNTNVPSFWRGRIAAVRNAAGHTTRFENYDVFGNATRVVDANGIATESTYDGIGRLVTSTIKAVAGCETTVDPLCATDLTSSRSYEATYGPLLSDARPSGSATTYEYDTRGRVKAIVRPASATLSERVEYDYSGTTGRKTAERYLSGTTGSWVLARSESYQYDTFGRLTTTTHSDGTTIAYAYDALTNLLSVKDENHTTPNTAYQYDPANRLSRVTQTLASAPGGTISTQYGYDAHGNLNSVTDPNGNTTTYAFDDFDRMTRQTSPVTGMTTYSYDAANNLLATTDANNSTTTRTYDVLNRVTSSTSSRTGAPTETITWAYDTASNGIGRLASMSDATGSTGYAYERRGLLIDETKTINGAAYVSAYRYDSNGNRSRITYPSGRVVDYTFDQADRPVTATTGGQTLVSSAAYLPFGPATSMVYGNGTTRTTSFDNRYRVTRNKLTGSAGMIDYTYNTDAAGNITRIYDATDAAFNRDFGYDDLNRLTTANTGTSLWGNGSYQYDAMGNLLSQTIGSWRSGSFTYQSTTPKIATATNNGITKNVTYDPAGNEATVGSSAYGYTARNSLATGEGISYTYDGRGVRTITSFPDPGVTIASITTSPTTVTGGEPSAATITLSAPAGTNGATIALSNSNPGILTVPATLTIPAGSTTGTFTITSAVPTRNSTPIVTAALYDSTRATTLNVLTPAILTSITIDPASPVGGTNATGTVTTDNPATGNGLIVTLTSSNPSVVSVPASATMPNGSASATFNVTTTSVASDTSVTISATYANTTRTTTVLVRPADVTLSTMTLAPSRVFGGSVNGTSTGTLTLTAAAPPSGATVTLSSSSPSASVPASLTIPAGNLSGTFTVSSTSVSAETPATITGSYGTTRTANLTVSPCVGFTVAAPALGADETVWVEDSAPGPTDFPWTWTTAYKVSGAQSHEQPAGTGIHEHYFYWASPVLNPPAGNLLTTWVLLDPCNPPREIIFEWQNNRASSDYRAYWGENLINRGTNDTQSRRYIGPLPAVGQWTRLDVPATILGLHDQNLTGHAYTLYDGHAWFDRTSKATCTMSTIAPPSSFPSTEEVWFDDTIPTGGTTVNWTWDTSQYATAPRSHTNPIATGDYIQHYFYGATQTTTANTGDTFFVYVLLDPCATPGEIMVQFEGNGAWTHRARWGGDEIALAATRIGDRPPAGHWVRLEIPAAAVGMVGIPVTGVAFASKPGTVWWDRVGIIRAQTGSLRQQGPTRLADARLERDPSIPPPTASSSETPITTTINPSAVAPSRRERAWSWIKTRIFRRPPPVALSIGAPVIGLQDTVLTKQRYSLYTPELSLMAETATSTATNPPVAYEYIWFNGEPLAQVEAATNTVHWYFNDHLGAPLLTTNSDGAVDWRTEREPYGTTYTRTGGDRHQPLGLPGQEIAPDLHYNIFRWYRTGWGRYTQADPVGLGDAALYAYTDDQPINYVDPYGLYKVQKAITVNPHINPGAICGSPFACSLVGAAVGCTCDCGPSGYEAHATLIVGGSIYVFSGPFGMIKKKPRDPTVKNAATAIAHEYNWHIDPGIASVDPLLKALESTSYVSAGDCQRNCSATSKLVAAQFASTLAATQAAENK